MKKVVVYLVALVFTSSTILTGCQAVNNTNKTQRGAAIGAVGGGILGAVLGNNLGKGGNGALGAVLGTAIGGGSWWCYWK